MRPYEFWSNDRRFGLSVREKEMAGILALCSGAKPSETGGILVGLYTPAHDCAIVTHVTGAPPDSRSGCSWFHRGTQGLQPWLDRMWVSMRHFYLGEWHFHPGREPVPSPGDVDQMKSISESPSYRCPEPVLLIVGGDPESRWAARAYVFPRHRRFIVLPMEDRVRPESSPVGL